jgi:hypothetical protein
MSYNFRFVSGRVFSLELPQSTTILAIKQLIHDQFPDVPVDVVKLIYRSSILPDPLPIGEASISPNEYIVVQPLSFRPKDLPPFDDDLPPPTPAAVDSPPPVNTQLMEILAGAPLIPPTARNARALQNLLDMGFADDQAQAALFRNLGNVERAADALLNQQVAVIQNMRTRHRDMLLQNRGAIDFILQDIITLVPPEMAEAYLADPLGILRDLNLDPGEFDTDGLAARLGQNLAEPPQEEPPAVPAASRDDEDRAAVERLMPFAGELPEAVVRDIYVTGGRNEEQIRELLNSMTGS